MRTKGRKGTITSSYNQLLELHNKEMSLILTLGQINNLKIQSSIFSGKKNRFFRIFFRIFRIFKKRENNKFFYYENTTRHQ